VRLLLHVAAKIQSVAVLLQVSALLHPQLLSLPVLAALSWT
jgi:hypothetical protein